VGRLTVVLGGLFIARFFGQASILDASQANKLWFSSGLPRVSVELHLVLEGV